MIYFFIKFPIDNCHDETISKKQVKISQLSNICSLTQLHKSLFFYKKNSKNLKKTNLLLQRRPILGILKIERMVGICIFILPLLKMICDVKRSVVIRAVFKVYQHQSRFPAVWNMTDDTVRCVCIIVVRDMFERLARMVVFFVRFRSVSVRLYVRDVVIVCWWDVF